MRLGLGAVLNHAVNDLKLAGCFYGKPEPYDYCLAELTRLEEQLLAKATERKFQKGWKIGLEQARSQREEQAAGVAALAKKLLEVHGRGRASTAQTLALANRDIFSDLDERTFVTVFYGLISSLGSMLTQTTSCATGETAANDWW